MTKPKVQLGDLAQDNVSLFKGICIARTEWINGCWRVTLQPQGLDKDGKVFPTETFDEFQLFPTETFDEFQLTVIEASRVPSGSKDTGGPNDNVAIRPTVPR